MIGPNANSIVPLNGNYHGTANQYHTVLEAVRKALPDARVNYSKGCHLYEHKLEDPGYSGDCLAEVKAQTEELNAQLREVFGETCADFNAVISANDEKLKRLKTQKD